MKRSTPMRTAVLALLLLPAAAHADDKTLPPIIAVKKVGEWCAKPKAPPAELQLVFAEPTQLDRVSFEAAGEVTVRDGAEKLPATHKGKRWEVALPGPVKQLGLTPATGCISDLRFARGTPLIDAAPDAVAALPAALKEMSAALDKCDQTVLGQDLVFPFTYKNAIHENTHLYKTAEQLAKACVAWRKKAVDVDLDAVAAPVPDAIYRRWSDITVVADGPARLALAVTHVRRPQLWRLEWRESRWRLLTIDY